MRKLILGRVKQELLTPRGIRTLTPKSPVYKGTYYGSPQERELAYHQGTVRPWLLGHFVEGYLKIHGKIAMSLIDNLYKGFVSYAGSVAELLRIKWLIDKYNQES